MKKTLSLFAVIFLTYTNMAYGAGNTIQIKQPVRPQPIYAPPQQKYPLLMDVTINRIYNAGDELPLATYNGLTRNGHQGIDFYNNGVSNSHAILINASDGGMIGTMNLRVYTTTNNFLARACPRTIPVSINRNAIETFWTGQAQLTSTLNNHCQWDLNIDSDEMQSLYEYLTENDGHFAYMQIGPRTWSLGDQMGIALGFLYEGSEYRTVLDEYQETLESIIIDNDPLIEDLMWDHAAQMHVTQTQNYFYTLPR